MGAKESGHVDVEDENEIKEPGKSVVIMHNDDYTTMEFVLEVLEKFFKKTHDEAHAIMLSVHHNGQAVAGIFTNDIAETKVGQVTRYAKAHGYPLRVTAEPA